jgi:O-antigen biosynthesis protein
MNILDFSKLNILITNHHLVNFSGSELTTFYMAKEFQSLGCSVTIATFYFDSPIKKIFDDQNIKVVNVLENKLKQKKFDLIWSHHSPVLTNCIFENNVIADTIIFSSLSPFEPLEAPPVFANMLSLCLANSMETRDKLINEGVDETRIFVLNNSVSNDFFDEFDENKICDLKRICIISNHTVNEIDDLAHTLDEKDIECDIYGINHKFELITPQILQNYDAVITIGRTVQYGLAMGIPVYCYDRFGGPGWITCDNFNSAEYYNFSGRCTNRKLTAIEICNEIMSDYKDVFKYRLEMHHKAKNKFSLEKNILEAMNKASKKTTDLNIIIKLFFMSKRINEYYESEIKIELSKNNQILNLSDQILKLSDQLKTIYNSRGWKFLNFYYKIKKKFLF